MTLPPLTLAQENSLPDANVIAASLQHPEAFRMIFDRHYDRVHRYAVSRVGGAGEDIAADTFVIAFQRRRRYDSQHLHAAPWLLGIATNLIRRAHRNERRRLRTLAALHAERPPAAPEPADGSPSAIAHVLLRLHRRDRDVLLLHAIGELSYAEIAAALGIPEGTVRSRLNRARRVLKEAIPRD
jgi:RNA polymerase sigma-70 factor (ECF subfamily)